MNKSTHKIVIELLVFAMVGACAPSNGAFYIEAINEPNKSCKGEAGEVPPPQGGSLDLGINPQYFLQLGVGTFLKSNAVSGGSSLALEPADRERLDVRKLLLSYSLTTPGARTAKTLRTDEVPLAQLLEGSMADTSFLTVNIIGPRGAEDLLANIESSTVDDVPSSEVARLVVSMELEARLTGSGSVLRTGVSTFPISVYRSATCGTRGYLPGMDRCFYPGQDRPTRVTDAAECKPAP